MTKIKAAIAGVITTLLSISVPLNTSARTIRDLQEFHISCNEGAYYYKIQSRNCDSAIDARTIELLNFSRQIEANPNNSRVYDLRGMARQRMGDYWGAITDYSKAIDLDSSDATAYHKRGLAYQTLGNPWQAIADYQMAIEIDDSFAIFHQDLADSRVYVGDYNAACADYLAAINMALESNDSETYVKAWRNMRLYCRGVFERFPR